VYNIGAAAAAAAVEVGSMPVSMAGSVTTFRDGVGYSLLAPNKEAGDWLMDLAAGAKTDVGE
jgi:hypothetical protein